jgi:hypothetical protein
MRNRRLTDRIKELCEKVQDHTEPEWNRLLRELQSAIQEHTLRLYNLSAATALAGPPNSVRERRRGTEDLRETGGIRYLAYGSFRGKGDPQSKPSSAQNSQSRETRNRKHDARPSTGLKPGDPL